MGSDSDGGQSGGAAEGLQNVFALVIYIPDPLGKFLDDLRREVAPGCKPHAHVSVLPPRPLGVGWQVAADQVRELTRKQPPFDVSLAEIRIFPLTDVIYIEVGAGAAELHHMHNAINRGSLAFAEPFVYQPHITLAQELGADHVQAVHELAMRRWKAFRGPHAFRAEKVTLVRNAMGDSWIDLQEFELGAVTVG